MKLRLIDIWVISANAITALALLGCASSTTSRSSYTPFSHHFKQTKGDSNLSEKYPDHPHYESVTKYSFERDAEDYLKALKLDLEEIKEKAENARDKVEAVSDAFRFYDGGYLHVSTPLSISYRLYGSNDTNFSYFGYAEFDDWSYFLYPNEPGTYADRYDWIKYKQQLLDLAATADTYIEDGNHYIRNCVKDHELVRQRGLTFLNYLENLERSGVELDLDLNFF